MDSVFPSLKIAVENDFMWTNIVQALGTKHETQSVCSRLGLQW